MFLKILALLSMVTVILAQFEQFSIRQYDNRQPQQNPSPFQYRNQQASQPPRNPPTYSPLPYNRQQSQGSPSPRQPQLVTPSSPPPPPPPSPPKPQQIFSKPKFQPQNEEPQPIIDGPSEYNFQYGIEDESFGDYKKHEESRNENEVKGVYTVVQPDGKIRIVEYTSNAEGFNAVVRYEETDVKIPPPPTPKSLKSNLIRP